ncbi:hypothetical protein BJY22_005339 [Kribbella shirazensis]|uniref:Uncharacterized protein n=1 Tax=Kribbella shirazensis TaxID=1105143 RepID=A0A7X5VEE1_9ACTN|nr:hypothetical protein [Kribbella shirazensis]NIK59622.1 hypothetical protein [Kribbella shirazensis]
MRDAEADVIFDGYVRRHEAGWAVYDDAVPGLRAVRDAGLGDSEQPRPTWSWSGTHSRTMSAALKPSAAGPCSSTGPTSTRMPAYRGSGR